MESKECVIKGSKVMEDDKRVFFLLLTEYSLSISSGCVQKDEAR